MGKRSYTRCLIPKVLIQNKFWNHIDVTSSCWFLFHLLILTCTFYSVVISDVSWVIWSTFLMHTHSTNDCPQWQKLVQTPPLGQCPRKKRKKCFSKREGKFCPLRSFIWKTPQNINNWFVMNGNRFVYVYYTVWLFWCVWKSQIGFRHLHWPG